MNNFVLFWLHSINFTRPEGGDDTDSISPTDNAVKLFMWKSIAKPNIKAL